MRLTDRAIKALKSGAKVIDYPDALQPGLVLRVWPSGAKSWGVRYWLNGSCSPALPSGPGFFRVPGLAIPGISF